MCVLSAVGNGHSLLLESAQAAKSGRKMSLGSTHTSSLGLEILYSIVTPRLLKTPYTRHALAVSTVLVALHLVPIMLHRVAVVTLVCISRSMTTQACMHVLCQKVHRKNSLILHSNAA